MKNLTTYLKHFLLIVALHLFAMGQSQSLNSIDSITPGEMSTVKFVVENTTEIQQEFNLVVQMSQDLKLVSMPNSLTVGAKSKRLLLVKIRSNDYASPGRRLLQLTATTGPNNLDQKQNKYLEIKAVVDVDIKCQSINPYVFKGDTLVAIFSIQNNGNTIKNIQLESNSLLSNSAVELEPGESKLVEIQSLTQDFSSRSNQVSVTLKGTDGMGYNESAYGSSKVYASSTQAEDRYFKIPSTLSFYYNYYKSPNNLTQNLSVEVKGAGFLDDKKNHRVNYLIRVPNHNNRGRFGLNDQYTFEYNFKDKSRVVIGDQNPEISRLSFGGRFGMGVSLSQKIRKVEVSAFYVKPRLNQFFRDPMFGIASRYEASNSLSITTSLIGSQLSNVAEGTVSDVKVGVLGVDFVNTKTKINSEVAISSDGIKSDYAGQMNVGLNLKNIRYTGSGLLSGEGYMGSVRNSTQFSNALNYSINKWNIGVSQAFSKLNEVTDSLVQGVQPHFQNYNAFIGYKVNTRQQTRLGFFSRIREDKQIDNKRFHYQEQGVDYRFMVRDVKWSLSFSGRVAKTLNYLSEDKSFKNSFAHNLSGSLQLLKGLTVRGNINHNLTDRYNFVGNDMHYVNYGFGVSANGFRKIQASVNYNSGFSPEESFQLRDFINATIRIKPNRSHTIEARANLYAYPNETERKDWYANVKYQYAFGVPTRKIKGQASVDGRVSLEGAGVKGVEVICQGIIIRSDKDGQFDINNVKPGSVDIIVNRNTLPIGLVCAIPQPIKLNALDRENLSVAIPLVKQANFVGNLILINNDSDLELRGCYFRLFNDNFEFFMESDIEGKFNVSGLVPGTYKLEVIRMNGEKLTKGKFNQETSVELTSGVDTNFNFKVELKKRAIKFTEELIKLGK